MKVILRVTDNYAEQSDLYCQRLKMTITARTGVVSPLPPPLMSSRPVHPSPCLMLLSSGHVHPAVVCAFFPHHFPFTPICLLHQICSSTRRRLV